MVSGDSVCDSKHYLAGWEKAILKIQKDCSLPVFLFISFSYFASTEQNRVVTPMEESRSQDHGCISCSLGAYNSLVCFPVRHLPIPYPVK